MASTGPTERPAAALRKIAATPGGAVATDTLPEPVVDHKVVDHRDAKNSGPAGRAAAAHAAGGRP